MTKDEICIGLLRGMLSPAWQKPSERKIDALLKRFDDKIADTAPASISTENRRRLTALVTARTKLAAASRLIKEATIDLAPSGLPVEVSEDARKIAAVIDALIEQRITSAIEHIP